MILCVYEGEKTEKQIFDNLRKNFFSDKDFVQVDMVGTAFCGCIYDLYKKLKTLDFDADIVQLLKEHLSKKNCAFLDDYKRDSFSEVYLFFDFDPQRKTSEIEAAITEMLEVFNDETGAGKLYINYPMVESLKDLKKINQCCDSCFVSLSDIKEYKYVVSQRSDFSDFRKYNKEDWCHFCLHAAKKANCIVNGIYEEPSFSDFISKLGQADIFEKHKIKFYQNEESIILNSIPLFLLEYFGLGKWRDLINISKCYGTNKAKECIKN